MIYVEILPIFMGIAVIAYAVFRVDGKKTKAVGYVLGSMLIIFGVLSVYGLLSAPAAGYIAWCVDHKDERDKTLVKCMLSPDYVGKTKIGCAQAEMANNRIEHEMLSEEIKSIKPH